MNSIHAYTEASGAPYPGFVNLSTTHDEGGDKIVLTVRQQGHLGLKLASIVQSDEQLLALAAAILEYLNQKGGVSC